ncbi:cytochrome P450 [Nonomuraea muscovyensis]|uniref:Cytochrome P450 n=1 Tax=Nonomuraea muscovyensis TaxID=1124761 RepID=A0A7X0F0M3_9ACTN|nr:cytochrome P450 [Nonomuraea muscovyensis]MBB6347811.1 cytochrome P450 [Nonomuraea muscovyensis]MDF2709801.1 cytochrome [Nonomuraea muscovyensis]
MRAKLLPKFDALDPEVLDDPYPTYARLRAEGPLCRVSPASFGVTRLEHVAPLLRDRRLGNDFPEDNPAFAVAEGAAGRVFRRILPTQDVEEHSRLHRLMVAAFSPRTARGHTDRIRAVVDECLAPALDTGRLDVPGELAFPVAVTVVCELMGLPADARGEIWARAGALAKAFTPFLPEPDRPAADEALAWLRGYVTDVLHERRRRPAGDLVSRMLGELSDDEIVDNLAFLCFTGFETTMNMVSTGCLALARFPGEFARLRADRSLVRTAVEEFVRLDAPIQYTARVTREPVTIGDKTIKEGRSVLLMLGCANHDERAFADPGRLDVGRDPNPHVGFGGGVRGCLGAALARVEGAVVFDALLDRVRALELAGRPVRQPSALFRSYASIPLVVTPS